MKTLKTFTTVLAIILVVATLLLVSSCGVKVVINKLTTEQERTYEEKIKNGGKFPNYLKVTEEHYTKDGVLDYSSVVIITPTEIYSYLEEYEGDVSTVVSRSLIKVMDDGYAKTYVVYTHDAETQQPDEYTAKELSASEVNEIVNGLFKLYFTDIFPAEGTEFTAERKPLTVDVRFSAKDEDNNVLQFVTTYNHIQHQLREVTVTSEDGTKMLYTYSYSKKDAVVDVEIVDTGTETGKTETESESQEVVPDPVQQESESTAEDVGGGE